jgi:F0F1-type ATP synthase membrane subunit b/b'
MSPTVTTFLFELTNFLLLASLLGWLLFKPVRAVLQARQAAEKRQAEELAARAADSDRQRADLDQRLRTFETETAELRRRHIAAADEEAAAILTRAHDTVERERDLMKRGLAHLEHAQVERLSAAVAAATRESIVRLLATLNAPDLDASLARAACRQIEGLHGSPLGPVLIESARPLTKDLHEAIIAALNADAASATFRIVPDLGAGVRITTARGLIDSSASGLGRQAEGLVRDALATEAFEVTT